MAFDITKAEIAGPVSITHKGIVLGHVVDGVELTAQRELTEVNVDRMAIHRLTSYYQVTT
jgi:hypothetical protein